MEVDRNKLIQKSLISTIILAAFAFVLWISLRDERPPPNAVIPGVAPVIGDLSGAKESFESKVSMAKAFIPARRRIRGQQLYVVARHANTQAIETLIVALDVQTQPLSRQELETVRSSADAEGVPFCEWFDDEISRVPDLHGAGGPLPSISEIVEAVITVLNYQDSQVAAQRKALQDRLKECRWRSWDDIPSQDP